MQKDIRGSLLYQEAQAFYEAVREPATGRVSDAAELNVSPDGRHALFTATLMDTLDGTPRSFIYQIDLITGETRPITFGPHTDRLPKYSPMGDRIAFLSDRHKPGDFQLYLLDLSSGAARAGPPVQGWVEYFHWSPNGEQILLGVAGYGADSAGGHGGITSSQRPQDAPSWLPDIRFADEHSQWRRAWVYELASGQVRAVSHPHHNIWEAVWCGNGAVVAVVSPGPSEGLWYSARLQIIQTSTGDHCELYEPQYQLGWPAATSSGRYVAIIEAICSDRYLVAGELRLVDLASQSVRHIDTHGTDITYTEWRSERALLLAGHRGLETVVGLLEADSGTFTELWSSRELTSGGFYVTVSGINEGGDCALIGESFVRAPEIAVIRHGEYQAVHSFDVGYARQAQCIQSVECVNWSAADGLALEGWLLRPVGEGPYPLVMFVHGGPVWHWRPLWLGRKGALVIMLLRRGYAVFFPNPRGSSGRGQEFVRQVLGELGGADTHDCLSGLDYLVEQGLADPQRLGVTGTSYGGFMTVWLTTQNDRFAAAIPMAPITNHLTEHLISNIPHFVSLFLADHYHDPTGKYFTRSPIMYAQNVKTPTMLICGALDRCTPPEEAIQFYSALQESGVKSVLLTYPEEGHGIRKFPALIDCAARMIAWFEEHMPDGTKDRP